MEPATDNARMAIQEYLASLAARAEKADRKTSQEQQARGGAGRRQPEVRPRMETRGRKTADTTNIGMSSAVTHAAQHMERLTWRQTQTLILIAGGKTTQEIASALGISFKTAAAHRVRLMQRLGLHKSADVVRYAIRAGVVQP